MNKRYLEWIVAGWNEETFERDESWFQGVFEPFTYEDLASIKMLRDDLDRQRKELEEDTHADGYLVPFSNGEEILITQDGCFIWDDGDGDNIEGDYVEVFITKIYKENYHFKNVIEEYANRDVWMAEYELVY